MRGSVAQTADGNKQGAEPLGYPYHLLGLIMTHFAVCDSLLGKFIC